MKLPGIGLMALLAIVNLLISAAALVGGIWLVVWALRAVGVLA